jgi:hypothetical protein
VIHPPAPVSTLQTYHFPRPLRHPHHHLPSPGLQGQAPNSNFGVRLVLDISAEVLYGSVRAGDVGYEFTNTPDGQTVTAFAIDRFACQVKPEDEDCTCTRGKGTGDAKKAKDVRKCVCSPKGQPRTKANSHTSLFSPTNGTAPPPPGFPANPDSVPNVPPPPGFGDGASPSRRELQGPVALPNPILTSPYMIYLDVAPPSGFVWGGWDSYGPLTLRPCSGPLLAVIDRVARAVEEMYAPFNVVVRGRQPGRDSLPPSPSPHGSLQVARPLGGGGALGSAVGIVGVATWIGRRRETQSR